MPQRHQDTKKQRGQRTEDRKKIEKRGQEPNLSTFRHLSSVVCHLTAVIWRLSSDCPQLSDFTRVILIVLPITLMLLANMASIAMTGFR